MPYFPSYRGISIMETVKLSSKGQIVIPKEVKFTSAGAIRRFQPANTPVASAPSTSRMAKTVIFVLAVVRDSFD